MTPQQVTCEIACDKVTVQVQEPNFGRSVNVELDLMDGPDQVRSAVNHLTGIPPPVIVLRQSGVRVPAQVKVVDMLARDSPLRCNYVWLPGKGKDEEKVSKILRDLLECRGVQEENLSSRVKLILDKIPLAKLKSIVSESDP